MGKVTQKKRLQQLIATPHPGRWPSKTKEPPLFADQPPVSLDDLALWVEIVAPHISPSRRQRYIESWDVAGKVAAAKLAGRWPPTRSFIAHHHQEPHP